jgi:cell division protein FtsW
MRMRMRTRTGPAERGQGTRQEQSITEQVSLYGAVGIDVRAADRLDVPPLAHPAPFPRAAAAAPLPVAVTGAHDAFSARLRAWRRPSAPDYALLLGVVGLLLLGLVMVFSASQLAVPGDPSYWFRRQLVWALLGLIALVVTSRVDYRLWRRWAWPGLALAVTLLALVLVMGRNAYGAQRWLHLYFFSIQPSEFAKLALVVALARLLASAGPRVRTLRAGLLPFCAVVGSVLALVLLQNDLGTSLVIGALALGMLFAAGATVIQCASLGLASTAAYVAIVVATPFRRARLDAFLHPLPAGCSGAYQVCQGLISLGSGGIVGRGLGDSVQKAGYLPNPFTDSIFAVVGEELGLLGCLVLIGLFAFLAYRGLCISRAAPDSFGALLACGITCWIAAQAAINIGSVVNAIPFTGVPLPFVSFGGSSLVTALAAVGILLNVSRHRERAVV